MDIIHDIESKILCSVYSQSLELLSKKGNVNDMVGTNNCHIYLLLFRMTTGP